MCQTAMLDWNMHLSLAWQGWNSSSFFICPLKFFSYVENLHFQSTSHSICSREKHYLILNSSFIASSGSKLNPCFWSFWRYSNGSYSSGPSAIQPAATCKASMTWSLRSLSSTSSSTLVSFSRSILSVTCCQCDSLPFFFHCKTCF